MPGYGSPKKEKKKESFTGEVTIADVIESSPVHTIMLKLLKQYRLLKALRSSDKLTVFAPTNDAFRKVLPSLKNLSKSEVKNILLGHVLQYSTSPPPAYKKMKSFKTLASDGRKLNASAVLGNMKKSKALKLSNGTLYILDKVLI